MVDVSNRDYVVVVDKSGSMSVNDVNGKTRWEASRESVLALCAHLSTLDPDGVDLYFYNSSFTKYENVTPEKVNDIWAKTTPIGGTSFAPVLKDVFDCHFKKQARPTTILFITDGEATDKAQTINEIIGAANKIEADPELAISFIQVGKDSSASVFLKKLDDDLQSKGAKFDIVDTITMEEVESKSLNDVLLAAIED